MADPRALSSHPEDERRCCPLLGLSTADMKAVASEAATTTSSSNKTSNKRSRNVTLARIQQELKEIERDPPPYCWAGLKDPNVFQRKRLKSTDKNSGSLNYQRNNGKDCDEYTGWVDGHRFWEAMINGPPGTPYEGGIFFVDVTLPERYPFDPPQVRFTTPIFHANIRSDGKICLNLLDLDDWRPALSISAVLLSIVSLLIDPDARGSDEEDKYSDVSRQELFSNNKEEYMKLALEWTKKYAM